MKFRVSVSSSWKSINALIVSRFRSKSGDAMAFAILWESDLRSKSTFGMYRNLRFIKGVEADSIGVGGPGIVAEEASQAADIKADQSHRYWNIEDGGWLWSQEAAGTNLIAAAAGIDHPDIHRNFGEGEIVGLYAHIHRFRKHGQADMFDASQECRHVQPCIGHQ